jgi:hypothetical protein
MNKKVILVGSIGLVFLLFFCNLISGVNAQIINKNEQHTNIFQYIKEKIENIDWKPLDVIKEGNWFWFPGMYLLLGIYGLILLFSAFFDIFVF